MKLLLTSAGFSTPEIVAACVELAGKPQDKITFAIINEAYAVEHGDHWWVFDDLNNIRQNFKGGMELVNILALDSKTVQKRIELADVIFVVGGHTDYLMNVFRRTGFNKILLELLARKVYVGSSAGSMVIGKRVPNATYHQAFAEGDNYGTDRYMEMVDFAIKPHFNSSQFRPYRNEQLLQTASEGYKGLIYCPEDTQAIMVTDDTTRFIGGKPFCVRDGDIITV